MQYLGAPWVPISAPSQEPEILKRILHCYQPGGSSHTYPFLFSLETLWFRGIMMMPEFPRRFMNNQDPEVGGLPAFPDLAFNCLAFLGLILREMSGCGDFALSKLSFFGCCLSWLSVMFITMIGYFVVGVGWIYKNGNWLRV